MTVAAQIGVVTNNRGRPTKFTPERIQQICNLVERGRTREEIAEIIGVTTGTLQVTCSKLGISLRRPRFHIGTGLLPQHKSLPRPTFDIAGPLREQSRNCEWAATNETEQQPSDSEAQSEGVRRQSATGPRPTSGTMPAAGAAVRDSAVSECNAKLKDGEPAVFAVQMEYKGQERSTGLPLDEEMIGHLALEAEIRGVRIGELVAALIVAIVKKDLFELVRTDTGTHERP